MVSHECGVFSGMRQCPEVRLQWKSHCVMNVLKVTVLCIVKQLQQHTFYALCIFTTTKCSTFSASPP